MNKVEPQLISVDWGTTSLRCYLVASNGQILGLHTSPDGIMSISDRKFGETLQEAVTSWLATYGDIPIYLSGMIGSRQGWHEAPYVPCPVHLDDLRARLIELHHPGLPAIHLSPGADTRDEHGHPDVMRGEEMQIFGALAATGRDSGLFVLPGTHAKWVNVEHGTIAGFRTYMTGEVFAALKNHTILGRLTAAGPHRDDAFLRGLQAASGTSPGDLLHMIFSARSLVLFRQLSEQDVESYLSGLLIGAEILSACVQLGTSPGEGLVVLGEGKLAARYKTACEALGFPATTVDADCIVFGHLAIASAGAAQAGT